MHSERASRRAASGLWGRTRVPSTGTCADTLAIDFSTHTRVSHVDGIHVTLLYCQSCKNTLYLRSCYPHASVSHQQSNRHLRLPPQPSPPCPPFSFFFFGRHLCAKLMALARCRPVLHVHPPPSSPCASASWPFSHLWN